MSEPITLTESIATANSRTRRKKQTSRVVGDWALRVGAFVVLVGAWELWARGQSRALIAPPSEVVLAAGDLIADGSLLEALAQSLGSLLIGVLLTFPIGYLLGLLVGRSRLAEYLLDPYVSFLYVLPGVALIPLFVLWFGFDLQLRLALVFMAAVFPLIVNTASGVKNVDAELEDGARSYNASELQILLTVVIPGSFPFALSGLRIAFAAAWVAVVVAEMTALVTGAGGLIVVFANEFKTAAMFVPIICIMLVGILVNVGMDRLYHRFGNWDNRGREA